MTRPAATTPGKVWLTPGMCAQLGLPETLDPDRDKRARQLEEASTGCGWMNAATEEGWQVGRGRLAGWMRVWQQGTRSAFVVLMSAGDPTLGFLESRPGLAAPLGWVLSGASRAEAYPTINDSAMTTSTGDGEVVDLRPDHFDLPDRVVGQFD